MTDVQGSSQTFRFNCSCTFSVGTTADVQGKSGVARRVVAYDRDPFAFVVGSKDDPIRPKGHVLTGHWNFALTIILFPLPARIASTRLTQGLFTLARQVHTYKQENDARAVMLRYSPASLLLESYHAQTKHFGSTSCVSLAQT